MTFPLGGQRRPQVSMRVLNMIHTRSQISTTLKSIERKKGLREESSGFVWECGTFIVEGPLILRSLLLPQLSVQTQTAPAKQK